MADKKKMSVADILAAARQADGGGSEGGSGGTPGEVAAEVPVEGSPGASAPAEAPTAAPVPKPGSAGRPSAADILAMARAGKGAGGQGASGKASPKPAAKASPAKPAAAQGAADKKAPAKGQGAAPPRDTASILAAARKKDKPGPMSKAEAAAKASAPTAGKAPVVVPPMPAKPAYAQPATTGSSASGAAAQTPKAVGKAAKSSGKAEEPERRGFLALGFGALGAVTFLWTMATVKFMFPNVLREPPSKFKVGFPDAFPEGQVETKYKAQFGVWVVNTQYNGETQLVALKTVCTHLGCTPNWLEAEQKFKCPCHGSGFYKDGINFEGPAPRPLERYAIRIADDGQIEIDKSRTFQEEMGQWEDPSCYIPV